MDLRTLKKLISLMNQNDLVEVEIEEEGRKVRLRKGGQIEILPADPARGGPAALGAGAAASGAAGAPAALEEKLVEFYSPMVGTFYRAQNPESPAFVKEGDVVHKGTVLCIIEAMKVMNEIRSENEGEIVQILARNGEAVEYHQPLFLLRPRG